MENISANQVNSQIDILNADYAGTGYNVGTCPAPFQSLIANTNMSFCKAAKNPSGVTLLEPGIDRVDAQLAGFTNPGAAGWSDIYIDATIKHATTWDATKYINIWVLPLESGTLGYATFPGGPSNEDGVVIGYLYYGNTGTVSAPYDKGRTASHELGHWFGLLHISGDSRCGDDFCNDTPSQRGGNNSGLNYGCPTYPFQVNGCGAGTSPNGELFMNFMDYVDDPCMFLFTPDQRTRMQTAMTTNSLRIALTSSAVCNTTPQAPVANFSANKTSICSGNNVTFTDLSSNTPTSWSWSFPGGTPSTSIAKNPTVTYNSVGTYNVTLTATNTIGSDGETKNSYISVSNTAVTLPLSEGFQSTTFPPTGWTLNSISGYNWERHSGTGGFGTSNACMKFNNTDNDGQNKKDDIISPSVSLNSITNPRVKFDVAHAPYNDGVTFDTLEVLVMDACAGTTQSIYKKGGNELKTAPALATEFVPTSSQWRQDSVNIPVAFLNKNVKIIFRNYGKFGHTIYVDNINIYGVSSATPTVTASFSGDTTVCIGGSITFTNTSSASTGSLDSVRWIIPGGIPSTSTSTTMVTATFNTVNSYVVTLKAYKGGISNTATKSIRVKAKPTVTVSSPSICSGQAATLTANGATSYSWSNSLGTGNPKTTLVLTSNASYTVTGTADGCTNTATSTVTVKPVPGMPIITQRNDTLFCSVAGASYNWYKNGVFFAPATLVPSVKISQSGTYSVEVVGANACTSLRSVNFSASITAVRNNKFDIKYAILPNPSNGMFDLAITSTANKSYQIKLYNVSGQLIMTDEINLRAGQNTKHINVSGIEKGVYFLSLIGEDGISTQSILIQ